MRKLLFKNLLQAPLTEPAPPAREEMLAELARTLDRTARRRTRPQPLDPRGGRRFLQRLRARDPCAEQRLLRPGAVRATVRGLAPPCRRATRDRTSHAQHARGAGTYLPCDARSEVGGCRRRLRPRRGDLRWRIRLRRWRVEGHSRRSSRPRLPAEPDDAVAGSDRDRREELYVTDGLWLWAWLDCRS